MRIAAGLLAAAWSAAAAAPAAGADAGRTFAVLPVVERLAELGPRLPATAAHAEAAALLADELRRLGLDAVRIAAMKNGTRNVEGVLPGADAASGEIVLSAHYDTVAGSPGALDDASGCAVVLGAVAEIGRAPLRRTLRVLFFDGEEAGLLGSTAWVATLTAADRDRVLGALDVDAVGADRSGAPVVLDLGGGDPRPGRGRTPAWMVHAALRAGAAVGFPFRADDYRWPLLAQLLTRTAVVPWSSDAVPLLEAGIPALVVTDFSALHPDDAMHTPLDSPERLSGERLERWVTAIAATVRRLDALEGRPRWEEEYLVAGGRVWIRRDLIWLGFALWVALVVRGRPGRWAGAGTGERKARGRSYLPGYLFRVAFLVAAVWMPALAAPLVYPLAPLALFAPRTQPGRVTVAALAIVPTVAWLAVLAIASGLGMASGLELAPGKAALLAACLGSFGWQLWSGSPRPPVAANPATGPLGGGVSVEKGL